VLMIRLTRQIPSLLQHVHVDTLVDVEHKAAAPASCYNFNLQCFFQLEEVMVFVKVGECTRYTLTFTHIHSHTLTHTHTLTYTHTHTHIHTYTHTLIHIHSHTRMYTHTHNTHSHTRIYTYTYVHIHTQCGLARNNR
jgi:hypothetical protein